MKILITGATGFLGGHIADRLAADGHQLTCAVRNPDSACERRPAFDYAAIDFNRATEPERWLPLLAGIDVVINAVGILREAPGQSFDVVHTRAPSALFSACATAGVRHVIQISALGADEDAQSRYHVSKRAADDHLRGLPLRSTIVQPSLVFGLDGASARMFGTMASLPLIPLPGHGDQRVQPVHVDDVVDAVARLVAAPETLVESGARVAVVGPRGLTLRSFLASLRATIGICGKPRFLPVPDSLTTLGAKLAGRLPGAFLDTETLQMLRRGNTADARDLRSVLGRDPRPVADFVPAALVEPVRLRAQLGWLLPVLRLSIALVWILTAIVSFGLYPIEASYALLAEAGVPAALRPAALYGAAVLDLVLGALTLFSYRRAWVWQAQVALIVGYMVIITLKLPEFWLHPYGPISKNLPMLAAIWLLYELESRKWST